MKAIFIIGYCFHLIEGNSIENFQTSGKMSLHGKKLNYINWSSLICINCPLNGAVSNIQNKLVDLAIVVKKFLSLTIWRSSSFTIVCISCFIVINITQLVVQYKKSLSLIPLLCYHAETLETVAENIWITMISCCAPRLKARGWPLRVVLVRALSKDLS